MSSQLIGVIDRDGGRMNILETILLRSFTSSYPIVGDLHTAPQGNLHDESVAGSEHNLDDILLLLTSGNHALLPCDKRTDTKTMK